MIWGWLSTTAAGKIENEALRLDVGFSVGISVFGLQLSDATE
jgi:hypothetical protein